MSNAHEEITAALEAQPAAVQMLVNVTHRLCEAMPADARKGAVLFLTSSLVALYANHPQRAVTELNAHALDAVHHALSI